MEFSSEHDADLFLSQFSVQIGTQSGSGENLKSKLRTLSSFRIFDYKVSSADEVVILRIIT